MWLNPISFFSWFSRSSLEKWVGRKFVFGYFGGSFFKGRKFEESSRNDKNVKKNFASISRFESPKAKIGLNRNHHYFLPTTIFNKLSILNIFYKKTLKFFYFIIWKIKNLDIIGEMIRFFNVSIFGSPFVENRAAQKRNKKIGWSEWVVHLDCSLCFNFNFCAVSLINMESIQIICILYNTVKKIK